MNSAHGETPDNPISEPYSIQQSLVVLSKHLDSEDLYGEAHIALLLSKSLGSAVEKLDNEDWQKPATLKAA